MTPQISLALGSYSLALPAGGTNVDAEAKSFTAAEMVRYVRVTITSSHGAGFVGLGKVRFQGVDTDGDGIINFYDSDDDGDGIPDASDNCRLIANAGQADGDADGIGDDCDNIVNASAAIGAPVDNGTTISYTITYSNAASVTLSDVDVVINASGDGTASAAVTGSGLTTRTVTLSGISGTTGDIGISLLAGTADNATADGPTAAVGPSAAMGFQTITFGALAEKSVSDPDFDLTATGGASGNAITYESANTSVATVSGSTVTIVGAGVTDITASQAGNANYLAAPDVIQSLTVKENQTIVFDALSNRTYGDAPFTVSATGGASGNPVTFSGDDPTVATVSSGGDITIVGAGTLNITANQAGNAIYTAANPVVQSLTIDKTDLSVRAQSIDVEKNAGVLPAITFEYRGFANAEGTDGDTDISGLAGSSDLNTISASAPGIDYSSTGSSYDLVPDLGTAVTTNYNLIADAVQGQATIIDSPPVITLLGNATVGLPLGGTYTDAGATAADLADGDLTSSIVINNPVDVNTLGVYTITYNVVDGGGNSATEVTRTVEVYAQGLEALHFDGQIGDYDYLSVPDHSSLDLSTSFTLETWINFDQVTVATGGYGWRALFAKSSYFNAYGLMIYAPAGGNRVVRFYHEGLSTANTDYRWTTINPNTWYHIAVTYDGAMTKIYIDGEEVSSAAVTGTLTQNNSDLNIGFSQTGAYPWDGKMDEVRIWNDARTQEEIWANMGVQLNGDEQGLVLYYDFNEGVMDGDNSSLTTVTDKSTSGNNGTLNGFALTGSAGNYTRGMFDRASQEISFDPSSNKTYADPDFDLTASVVSGLPITYVSTDPAVASLSGSTVTVNDLGTTDMLAFQAGDATYLPAFGKQSLTIDKAELAVRAQSVTVEKNAGALPAITFEYRGFADGEGTDGDTDVSGLAGVADVNTIAASAPGIDYTSTGASYDLEVNVGSANATNYSFAPDATKGQVTIVDSPPVITLLGNASEIVGFGSSYTDAGATATDLADGDLTASIVVNNPVDTNTPGNYAVTYDVMDSGGNSAAQVTRDVEVTAPPTISVVDTLKVQVELGKTAVANLVIDNVGVGNLSWSTSLSDTLGYGYDIDFNKVNFASWQLAENQDRITDNVYITRGDNKSIFNARTETTSSNNVSPADTEWSRSGANKSTAFNPFHAMHGGNPGSLIGDTITTHLITDDQYHEVVFSSFSGGNTGGGFAYTRTPMHDYLTLTGTSSGNIATAGSATAEITFDATQLRSGFNYGVINITNNDPNRPMVSVIAEVEVLPSAVLELSVSAIGDTVQILDPAVTKTFTISNPGPSELNWSSNTDDRPSEMGNVTLDAYSGTVPAGGSQVVTVSLDNKFGNPGAFNWPLKITSNAVNNSQQLLNISLKLEGVPVASLPATTSPATFPTSYPGFTSKVEYTISNTGTDTLFVTNIATDLVGMTTSVDSVAISSSSSHTIDIIYVPVGTGSFMGNLTFNTNDINNLSATVPLTAEVVDPPTIDVNPASISESMTVNDTVSTTVTINNTGGSDLTWNAVATLPDAPIFVPGTTVNFVSDALQSDNISSNVTIGRTSFGATAGQDFYNQIEYTNVIQVQSASTTLRWSPKPTVESTPADYGDSFIDVKDLLGASLVGSTVSLHIIAENRYFDLEILTYEAPSGPFANFSYNRTEIFPGIGTTLLEGTTGAGANTQFDIEFYGGGLTQGAFAGTYTITSDDPLAPSLELPINLTVTGGSPDISATSTTASATDVQVGQTSNFSLEIINSGNAPLTVNSVGVDDPVFGVSTASFVVPAQGRYMLPISFSPTLAQTYNGSLLIENDDPANSFFTVTLTGDGLPTADFQVSSILIEETLAAGATSMQTLSIINNAAGELDWNVAGEVAFEKIDYADPGTEAAQDRISNFVWFTRGDQKPTYNYLESTRYIKNHTSILYGDGTTFSNPAYGTFDGTFNGSASGQVGNITSLYVVEEDRYFDLAYTQWTESGDGGGFAYTRREAVPWLQLGSLSGTISGIGQTDVTANFNATNLAGGDYEFTYDIATNDPTNPVQTVTFQLHVTGTPDIDVTFASDSVRFGDVLIGQTTTMPVTVSNLGDSILSVTDIVFDDPAFGIDQTAFKVEKGKNVVLNVSFTPTSVATYKAGFTITSDDPDESPITFGVRGSGIEGADLNVDIASLNIQVVAGGLATADLTLSNAGQQSLNWNVNSKYVDDSEVFFEKPESADWNLEQFQDRITGNVWITRRDDGSLFNIVEHSFAQSSTTIGWAENATPVFGALPTYDSPLGDVFDGGSNMSSIPGNTLSLHLVEADRYFDVYFNSWTTGNSQVGTGGFAYTRNEVATWLGVSEESGTIAVSGADQTLTLNIDAANLDAGNYTANLVLGSNGVEKEQTVVVNLIVVGTPQITVTQSALDFGDVIAGTEAALELEISNTGNSTLNVSDLSIGNPAFSISNSPLAIEPGTSTLVSVTFNPSLATAYAGTLTITNDDGANSSVEVSLSGTGINPPIASVDVTELNEALFLGTSSTQTFTIENTGSANLEWSLAADEAATTFINPNSDAVDFSVDSGVINSGSTQAIVVTFNPSGSFSGTFELPMQVVSNDPVNPRIDIPLFLSVGGITVNSTLADQLEQPGFGSKQFDITGMFTDAQGDALSYTVGSTDETIATVSELSNTVTVTEVGGTGTTIISITADDGKGTTETSSFDFRVNTTPTVTNAIGNQSYANGFASADFDLTTGFADADAGDVLEYSVITDATGIVGVSIANGTLTLTEQGPGTVNVTVTAEDGFGGQVSDVFEVSVDKNNQTITFNALSDVTYGDSAFDPGATASSGLTISYSSSNTSVATTSGTSITIVGAGTTTITASQAGDAAYNAAADVQQSLTVNQASLTVTADDQSKAYGEANPSLTLTYSGFQNGDDASSLTTEPTASATADANSDVGTYAITASGGAADNYLFSYTDGTLTVDKATLTVTAEDQTKTYGDANPSLTLTYSGFVNSEDATILTTEPAAGTTADASSGVGTYTITASGGVADNYSFSYTDGTLTVDKATLTVTADDQTKTYGEVNPSLTFTYSGFVNGEDASALTTEPTATTTADESSAVDTYAITASGGVADNYSFSYVDGTLTVDKGTLTVTADDQTKTYGEANPTLTLSYSGFVNGEDASSLTTEPTASTIADASSSVGTYSIVASGGAADNYSLSYTDGTLTVGQATLTVTADDQSKTYGESNPSLTFAYSGFVNGEDATSLASAPTASTTADASSDVGTYFINLSGGSSSNYSLSYVSGTLTVVQATLTAAVEDATRAFGEDNPAFTITYSGFVNGDDADALTTKPTATTTADATSTPGTYAISVSDGVSDNYSLTYTDGVLTVTKADQAIAFESLPARLTTDDPFDLLGVASSGLAVAYTSSDETVATISGSTVTIIGAGTTTITASQGGDDNYNAAEEVIQELKVDQGEDDRITSQITIDAIPDQEIGAAPFDFNRDGAPRHGESSLGKYWADPQRFRATS